MKKNNWKSRFGAFIFLLPVLLTAQSIDTIHFRKSPGIIYFFQKTAASDTVIKNKSDLFYLLVPDSLKPLLSIQVENGRLQPTANDSMVRLEPMRGLNYEGLYSAKEETGVAAKPKKQIQVLNSLINGSNGLGQENRIKIRFLNRKEEKVILENVFHYK